MTEAIMIYSAVMRAQLNRLNSVAQNASNVNSVGYLQESTYIDPNTFADLLAGSNPNVELTDARSTKLGALKLTNSPLDLAIASDHWFVLESNGDSLITRNGNFSISNDGYLVLGEHKVLGEAGPISSANANIAVRADGSIYLGEEFIGKLKIVSIPANEKLVSLGNGIYKSNSINESGGAPKIVQGALVGANVDLESDMTKVIETTRHIEMLQRAMSAYDDMIDVGINQLGK